MRLVLIVAVVGLLMAPAFAQETATCPDYERIVCDGWVTDAAGILDNEPSVESAAARFVAEHGHEIAFVIVATTGSVDPLRFATELGTTWGVGDSERDNGIVVLVALTERRTEIVIGGGFSLGSLDANAATANGFFADGDFDGGLIAIMTSLGAGISNDRIPTSLPSSDDGDGFGLGGVAVVAGLFLVGAALIRTGRRSAQAGVRARRQRQVDDALERLETARSEIAPSAGFPDTTVTAAVPALRSVLDGREGSDDEALRALWRGNAVTVIDRDRLLADSEVPLELRASQERRMLDDAVHATARTALEIPSNETERSM